MPHGRLVLLRRCALILLVFALHARPLQAQCVYTLSTTNISVPLTGTVGSFSVVTGTACSWTATSNASWITITAGGTGTGMGTVSYSVAASGAARTGTLTVAGQTVTINQGVSGCVYTVSTTNVSVPSTGSAGSLSVTTGTACSWTATSNASWITITAGGTGSGMGIVSYSVAPSTGAARSGTLTVAGQTVTINQAASSCAYNVSPTSVSVPAAGNSSTLSVTAGTSCSWTAATTVSWITITGGASGSGIGTVTYTVAPNTSGTARTGTMIVAGQTVTFSQLAGSQAPAAPQNLRIIRD